jgi:hypothetical protein
MHGSVVPPAPDSAGIPVQRPRDIAVLPRPALAGCASTFKVANLVDDSTIINAMHLTTSQRISFQLHCVGLRDACLEPTLEQLELEIAICEVSQFPGIACLLRKQYVWVSLTCMCAHTPESHGAFLIFFARAGTVLLKLSVHDRDTLPDAVSL